MLDDDYSLPTQLWMLRDTVRAEPYRAALKALVPPGSRVVDVGAGTGLLSIFAAEAGAAHVTAIERSMQVAAMARSLVDTTPWADRITVIASDAGSVELAQLGGRADVLVSEWMGFYAIEENLMGVVCDVRDRLCTPEVICLPGRFSVHAAPTEEPERVSDAAFWDSKPWGLEYPILIDALELRADFGGTVLEPSMLCGDPVTLWEDDIHTLDPARAAGTWHSGATFDVTRAAQCTGIALWFETGFPDGTVLSIAPGQPATHWGSTVLPLRRPIAVTPGMTIEVRVTCTPTVPGHSSTFWGVKAGPGEWEYHGGADSAAAAYELA